jgi:hypothetical protein
MELVVWEALQISNEAFNVVFMGLATSWAILESKKAPASKKDKVKQQLFWFLCGAMSIGGLSETEWEEYLAVIYG